MQCNAIYCNKMQCNKMQCNKMQYNKMQCNKRQCNTMQKISMQYNAMQCNEIQCNTIKYEMPRIFSCTRCRRKCYLQKSYQANEILERCNTSPHPICCPIVFSLHEIMMSWMRRPYDDNDDAVGPSGVENDKKCSLYSHFTQNRK